MPNYIEVIMPNLVSSLLESAHSSIDPSYAFAKEEDKKEMQQIGLLATAALITSIATGLFGLALTSSGGFSAVIGFPVVMISAAVSYLAFNAYKVTRNFADIIDNPKEYQKVFRLSSDFDKEKVKQKLQQNTLCFDWVIERFISKA